MNEAKKDTEAHEDARGSYADISWDREGRLSIWIRNPKVEDRRTYCNGFDLEDPDDIDDFVRALREEESFNIYEDDGSSPMLSFDGERLAIHPSRITRSVGIDLDADARVRFADFIEEV